MTSKSTEQETQDIQGVAMPAASLQVVLDGLSALQTQFRALTNQVNMMLGASQIVQLRPPEESGAQPSKPSSEPQAKAPAKKRAPRRKKPTSG